MELVIFNTKRSKKSREIQKLKTLKERMAFLTKGEVTAKAWMDINTLREFYRPSLNGIPVSKSAKKFDRYKTPKQAINAGLALKKEILSELEKEDS